MIPKYQAIRNLIMIVTGIFSFANLGFGLTNFETLLLIYIFMIAVILMDFEIPSPTTNKAHK